MTVKNDKKVVLPLVVCKKEHKKYKYILQFKQKRVNINSLFRKKLLK